MAFGDELQQFLTMAIPECPTLTSVELSDAVRVGPAPYADGKFSRIPLTPGTPGPWLAVEYKLADDPSGRYCRVTSSAFGLLVPVDKVSKPTTLAPVVRLEYEQSQEPSAHVHFHTSSAPLGWLYGVAGGAYRRSESLHFPVGSKRFRPTIEDFMLFLDRERIFRDWVNRPKFLDAARTRQSTYEKRQALATVKYFAQDIAEEMRELGWTVEAPSTR